jgi:hypothetical protein
VKLIVDLDDASCDLITESAGKMMPKTEADSRDGTNGDAYAEDTPVR